MRRAPLVLVLCGALGLAVVAFAAVRHRNAARRSVERRVTVAATQWLRDEGYRLSADLIARLEAANPARYDDAGALLRPAPPAEVRRFEGIADSITALYLTRDPARALLHATTSAERAAARLHLARVKKSQEELERALAEPALAGTELALRARLEGLRWRGGDGRDEAWRDDVSALVGGKDDRFARALLREAGVTPSASRAERVRLSRVAPRAGYFVEGGVLMHGRRVEGGWVLRSLPLPERLARTGPLRASLPDPLEMLELRGDVGPDALATAWREENRNVVAMYAGAAAMLLLGIGYAFVALRRADRLAIAKQDFLANVTHELKTPLANVRLYAESLQAGRVAPDDREEFLATILEETGRLDRLVEGLLHVARGPRLAFRSVDPRALLEELETRWRARLEREGFNFYVTAPELPPVHGDREALSRALSNLLDNARKYAACDPRLSLSGIAANGTVRLTVRDHGPGIPVGWRDEVMRPFTRLERADRKETEGAGLGLSLVVACMDAHGGRVEWGDAEGAEVTLVLPVHATRERVTDDGTNPSGGG